MANNVRRYDWNTGDESLTGQHVMYQDYQALEGRVIELEQQLAALSWTRVKALSRPVSEQTIWFHGTDEDTALLIQKEGFNPGTYFAAHMEDAVHFGGMVVFHVRVRWESPSMDGWQVVSSNHIGKDQIRGITVFKEAVIYESDLAKDAEKDALIAARLSSAKGGNDGNI